MTSTTSSTERVGRYQLLDPIGIGPSGAVSRAKVFGVAGFERQFAVKRFHPELTATAAMAAMLSAAARAYGSLEHPRIARMSEFGVAQGATFTAVEFVVGLDALRLIAEARLAGVTLAPGGALALVSQAARAVGYAHGRGLTHLGLAPTNVIITPDGDIKITDFGILSATLSQRPIEVPRLVQRIPYLAPEQLANEATSAATDVFALGVLAYELVTGTRTFTGDSPQQIAQAIMAGPPAEPALPRPIVRVLQRCLARSPFERFPDARALADALDAALRVAPVPGTRKDIGGHVKEIIDRLAALNEGQLSGLVALNTGTGPVPVPRSQEPTRDTAPPVHSVGRPDALGLRAPGEPASTLHDLPRPMMTMPGLPPPPIPVPPGVADLPIPPPPAIPATNTLVGIGSSTTSGAAKPVIPPIRPRPGSVGGIPPVKPPAVPTRNMRATRPADDLAVPIEPVASSAQVDAAQDSIHTLDPSELVSLDGTADDDELATASDAPGTLMAERSGRASAAPTSPPGGRASAGSTGSAPTVLPPERAGRASAVAGSAASGSLGAAGGAPASPSAAASTASTGLPGSAPAGGSPGISAGAPTLVGLERSGRVSAGAPASVPPERSGRASVGSTAGAPTLIGHERSGRTSVSSTGSAPAVAPAERSGRVSASPTAGLPSTGVPTTTYRLDPSSVETKPMQPVELEPLLFDPIVRRPDDAAEPPAQPTSPAATQSIGSFGPESAPPAPAEPRMGRTLFGFAPGASAPPPGEAAGVNPADAPYELKPPSHQPITPTATPAVSPPVAPPPEQPGEPQDEMSELMLEGFRAAPATDQPAWPAAGPTAWQAGAHPAGDYAGAGSVGAPDPAATLPPDPAATLLPPDALPPGVMPPPGGAMPPVPPVGAPAVPALPNGWIMPPPQPSPSETSPVAPRSSGRRAIWIAIGAIGAALLAFGGWQAYEQSTQPDKPAHAVASGDTGHVAVASTHPTPTGSGSSTTGTSSPGTGTVDTSSGGSSTTGTSSPSTGSSSSASTGTGSSGSAAGSASASSPGTGSAGEGSGSAASETLSIASTPPGARVFLDGADAGVTPLKLPGSPDRHNLALLLAGHELYLAQVDGHGAFQIPIKEVTPSSGPAGIKVLRCKDKERYYVYVDGKPTGQTCPTERIGCDVGPHTVEIYDVVSETRRKWDIVVKDTRLSFRIRAE